MNVVRVVILLLYAIISLSELQLKRATTRIVTMRLRLESYYLSPLDNAQLSRYEAMRS